RRAAPWSEYLRRDRPLGKIENAFLQGFSRSVRLAWKGRPPSLRDVRRPQECDSRGRPRRRENTVQPTTPTTPADEIQPGQALSIKRCVSAPGVDPLDTAEGETRNARIGHGDRGAFEQKDVEFPATWSQNATNI